MHFNSHIPILLRLNVDKTPILIVEIRKNTYNSKSFVFVFLKTIWRSDIFHSSKITHAVSHVNNDTYEWPT